MDWFMLIIPLVAVGIWAVKSAMEKGVEANRNLPPPARPGARPRSASAEIDRFLEEVNRRRQEQQQRQTRPAFEDRTPAREPPVAQAIEVEIEAPPPPPRPRPIYRPRPSVPPPVRRPSAEPIVVITPEQVIPEAVRAPATVGLATPPPALQAPKITRSVPPMMRQLQGLLRSPSSVRAAFVLTEIFGKPKCRRR